MKQLTVEAVGHLYLILKSRRCIIKSRKKHGFPAQKALELWESHASFTISTTQKGIPLILASISYLGYNLSNESYYLLH